MGRRGPPKGEGGAPRKEIKLDVARRAASIGCTAEEIAALLGVARATFYLNLERDPEFQRIIDEARASGRATLRRLQWQRANGGSDTMLIWLGKQMLGQKDKVETEATNTHHVSGAFVLGKGDPAEIAQTYRQIIDGTLGDES
jgi:hypothetical protein